MVKDALTALTAAILALALLALALMFASSAHADGVRLGTSRIAVDDTLHPGGRYILPRLAVSNPGENPARYAMSIRFFADQPERRPGPAWVRFNPQEFTLGPGASQAVEVSLAVPANAPPGPYFVLLMVQAVPEGGPGVKVGVAAASRLSFAVSQGNILSGALTRLQSLAASNVLLLSLAAGVVVLALAARWLKRTFTIIKR